MIIPTCRAPPGAECLDKLRTVSAFVTPFQRCIHLQNQWNRQNALEGRGRQYAAQLRAQIFEIPAISRSGCLQSKTEDMNVSLRAPAAGPCRAGRQPPAGRAQGAAPQFTLIM